MRLVRSPMLVAHGVFHGFSTREGGVSEGAFASLNLALASDDAPERVAENRRRFLADAGVDAQALGDVVQVHGDRVVFARMESGRVVFADSPTAAPLEGPVEADAVVASPGASAGIRVADCVPVLLFDPTSGAAAAVHAGWRGTVANIVEKAVRALQSGFGARPGSMRAAIGPAIGRCCYEVGDELAAKFEPEVIERSPGRPHLDLALANRLRLERAGLKPHHVESLGLCTACDSARFFSHRRDHGRTGRHLAVVAAARG